MERLKKGVMLGDGAMGTFLYMRGVPYGCCIDEQNISHPEVVLNVHRDYIKAGAELIETNTFGANQIRLRNFRLQDKVKQINLQGAKIAGEAKKTEGKEVFVAGSMGPLGEPLAPAGDISEKEAFDAFLKQAESLVEGGVDLFIVETFSDLSEIKQAVLAIRSICHLPIIASLTFDEDGKTLTGYSAEEVAHELDQMEVEIIGANCGTGPHRILEVAKRFKKVSEKMISIQPSAGVPRYVDGRAVYPFSSEHFTRYAREYAKIGANIIGGCCGTTPEYIRALSTILKPSSSPR